MKKIVIIGGGFAGIHLARKLAGNPAFQVTLVDRNNYNFFPPLLYQVATGYLEATNISYPFRKLLVQKKNGTCRFRMGEFQEVVPSENKVILSNGTLEYDYLVLATGAETNYFGMENVKKNALPMKTVNDALELRNHILQKLEQASISTDAEETQKLLNIVIAGGGPTGVEVSGMLAEMRKYVLPKDYPELVNKGLTSHIHLIDGSSQVLSPMSEQSQQDAHKALTNMGINIKLGIHVKDYVNDIVYLTNGETIAAKTLIWAAGVTASVFKGIPEESYGQGKRLLTDAYNKVNALTNVYAIGDTCLQTSDPQFPNGHPQLAQVAIQQGENLAKNLLAMKNEKKLHPFSYFDKGTMAIIGTNKAVADLSTPKVHFKGFIAWLMWIFVHVMSLTGYRNRIKTLFDWSGEYFSKDDALRLVIRPSHK